LETIYTNKVSELKKLFIFVAAMEKINDILFKVAGLFRKYGIKSVTMDDISRELGISKKTLYQFVTEKNDLVNKVIDFEMDRTKDCFETVTKFGKNAISELFEVNRFMVEMMKRNSPSFEYDLKKYFPEVHHKVLISRRKGMYDSVLANLKRGKAEGLYRSEFNEEIITKLQISRLENMYGDPMFSISDFSTENIFKELFIYHIRGIANEKGIRFLEDNIQKFDYSEFEMYKDQREQDTLK
jgi:AcrR family transcriptional regulator